MYSNEEKCKGKSEEGKGVTRKGEGRPFGRASER